MTGVSRQLAPLLRRKAGAILDLDCNDPAIGYNLHVTQARIAGRPATRGADGGPSGLSLQPPGSCLSRLRTPTYAPTSSISGVFVAVRRCSRIVLTCKNRIPADADEPRSHIWGSSGRRFKSCQPDTDLTIVLEGHSHIAGRERPYATPGQS